MLRDVTGCRVEKIWNILEHDQLFWDFVRDFDNYCMFGKAMKYKLCTIPSPECGSEDD
jgi:hypothetical protein